MFPRLTGPLDQETKEVIYNSYRRGIAVDTLAKRFQRTRTSMYRVINEVRAQQLLKQPLVRFQQKLTLGSAEAEWKQWVGR